MLATVLFTDIVGSTEQAAARTPTVDGGICSRPITPCPKRARGSRAVRSIRLATAPGHLRPTGACDSMCLLLATPSGNWGSRWAGLHTGECEAVGDKMRGIAVHIGARVAALAASGEILLSGTVKDLVAGAGIRFEDRGRHVLRGYSGGMAVVRCDAWGCSKAPGLALTAWATDRLARLVAALRSPA